MAKNRSRVRVAIFLITFTVVLFTVIQNLGEVFSAISYVWNVCAAIVAGLCIAFVLNVFMVFIEEKLELLLKLVKWRWRAGLLRAVSLFLTLALVVGFITLVIRVIAPRIVEIVEMLITSLPSAIEIVLVWLEGVFVQIKVSPEQISDMRLYMDNLSDNLVRLLKDSVAAYAGFALTFTTGLFSGLIDVILSVFISIYVLVEKERISRAIARFSEAYLPTRFLELEREISSICFDKFSCFIKGQLTEAFLLGAMCFLGMIIFGFPNPAMISMLVGASSLVPVIGPWVGSITSILLILLIDPLKALLFAVFILLLQQVEDNVIYPRIVGHSMGLPGLLVLCAVVIGSNAYGVFGIVLAVPLFGVLYEFISKRVRARIKKNGNSPPETPPDDAAEDITADSFFSNEALDELFNETADEAAGDTADKACDSSANTN